MKKLVRILLVAAVVAAIVWATREQMLPKPPPPDHHPPPFRTPPEPAAATTAVAETPPAGAAGEPSDEAPDDLQQVKGIGPVYEGKLHDIGIRTFAQLVSADSGQVAGELDVQVATVVDWKTQATEFLG